MVIRMENGAVLNTEKAVETWQESTWWNGSNWISRATGSQWEHQRLYKSRKNRYYVVCTSQWQGVATRAEWLSEEDAARWLITNEHDLPEDLERLRDAVEE